MIARKEYWFDNQWVKTTFRIEDIKVKGEPDYHGYSCVHAYGSGYV